MKQLLEVLKQRRVWAGIFGAIAFLAPQVGLNANEATDATMRLVEAISALLAAVLPIWSYIKPKIDASKE